MSAGVQRAMVSDVVVAETQIAVVSPSTPISAAVFLLAFAVIGIVGL
jgi:hypothetical protein